MFGGFGTDFDDDAILGLHMRQMNEMNSIVNSMFRGGGGGGGMMMGNDFGLPGMFNPFIGHHAQHQQALTGAHQQQQQQHQQHHHHQHQHHHHAQMLNALMPLGGMGGPFSGMAMPNMNRILMNGGNIPEGVTSFSSSQMVSMTQGPDGRPQVYQATSSTKSGPGGLRETKKTVEDSRTGVKKMAIGHHIGERSHVIEREKNFRSGHEEERQDFVNLEEEEVEDFDKEFQQRSRNYMRPTSNNNGHLQAITAGPMSPKISAVQPTTTPTANVTATSSSSSQHQQQPPSQQNTSPNNSSIHLHPYNQTQRRMYRPMKPRHQHQQQQQQQHQQHQQHQNQQQSQQPRQNNINNNNNIQQQ